MPTPYTSYSFWNGGCQLHDAVGEFWQGQFNWPTDPSVPNMPLQLGTTSTQTLDIASTPVATAAEAKVKLSTMDVATTPTFNMVKALAKTAITLLLTPVAVRRNSHAKKLHGKKRPGGSTGGGGTTGSGGGYYWAENSSNVTESAGTFTDVVDLGTVNINAATRYWGLWSCEANESSNSATISARLLIDGTSIHSQTPLTDIHTSGADYRSLAGLFFIDNSAGAATTHAVKLQGARNVTGTATFRNGRISLVAMGGNDASMESRTLQNLTDTTANKTATAVATLNYRASSSNYILIVSFTPRITNSTNVTFGFSLVDDDGSIAEVTMRPEGSSTIPQEPVVYIWPRTGIPVGDKTVTLKIRQTGSGTASIGIAEISMVALEESQFANVYKTRLGATSSGSETSPTSVLSQTFTPNAEEHLALASWHQSADGHGQLSDGGTVVDEVIGIPLSSYIPGFAQHVATYAASSRSQEIDRQANSGSVSILVGAQILTLELSNQIVPDLGTTPAPSIVRSTATTKTISSTLTASLAVVRQFARTLAASSATAQSLVRSAAKALTGYAGFDATGGTITTPGDGYRYWTFTATDTLVVSGGGSIEYCLVAGGGAGGMGGNFDGSGGGGAGGGVKDASTDGATVNLVPGSYSITIGAAGVGATVHSSVTSGGDSYIQSAGVDVANSLGQAMRAVGGGRGANGGNNAANGGSGGGGAATTSVTKTPGTGTSGQGHDGGTAFQSGTAANVASAGGGGANTAGSNATSGVGGNGGDGRSVFGTRYGAGGGGSSGTTQGTGGLGGGGTGYKGTTFASSSDATGYGAGGGGHGQSTGTAVRSGNGSPGIIILRAPISPTLSFIRVFARALTAATTPAAALVRQAGKVMTVAVDATGSLIRSTAKRITAAIDAVATVAALFSGGGVTLDASSTPAPAVVRQTGKPLAASTTPESSIIRRIGKIVAVAVDAAASLVRQLGRPITASTTDEARLTRQGSRLLTGSGEGDGSILRSGAKALSADSTTESSITRSVAKAISAAVDATASVALVLFKLLTIAADASGVATLARQLARALSRSSDASATLARATNRAMAGSTTPEATVASLKVRLVGLDLAADAVASIRKAAAKALAASSDSLMLLSRAIVHRTTLTTTPAPKIIRRKAYKILYTLLAAPKIIRRPGKVVTAAPSPRATMRHAIARFFSLAVTPEPSVNRQYPHALTGEAEGSATVIRGRIITAATTLVATIGRHFLGYLASLRRITAPGALRRVVASFVQRRVAAPLEEREVVAAPEDRSVDAGPAAEALAVAAPERRIAASPYAPRRIAAINPNGG
jgi:hypothetical protein